MADYDIWVLLLLAPALWWLMAMVRAVMDVRDRPMSIAKLDRSPDGSHPLR